MVQFLQWSTLAFYASLCFDTTLIRKVSSDNIFKLIIRSLWENKLTLFLSLSLSLVPLYVGSLRWKLQWTPSMVGFRSCADLSVVVKGSSDVTVSRMNWLWICEPNHIWTVRNLTNPAIMFFYFSSLWPLHSSVINKRAHNRLTLYVG